MPTAPVSRSPQIDASVKETLASLGRSKAITECQLKLLLDEWPELDEDWSAQPWFRSIREHSRFVIDQLRIR